MNFACGTASDPLGMEDRSAIAVKAGTQKRLLGHTRALRKSIEMESKVYLARDAQARQRRHHRVDIVEVYGGKANITAVALNRGLRALQPVDQIYGQLLQAKKDFVALRERLCHWKPFISAWEIACTAWSPLQRLNYTAEERAELQARQDLAIRSMVQSILQLMDLGCHFIIENPAYTEFWQHPALVKLRNHPKVSFRIGCMCNFNLRHDQGRLLKKPTGWLSDCPAILDRIALPCQGGHEHGQCMGGKVTKMAQVYTMELAEAFIEGVIDAMKNDGDERFAYNSFEATQWADGASYDAEEHLMHGHWQPSGDSPLYGTFFVDVNRHTDAWLPLLKEAEVRLQGKVALSTNVQKATPYFEQVRTLVPWSLERVEIFGKRL